MTYRNSAGFAVPLLLCLALVGSCGGGGGGGGGGAAAPSTPSVGGGGSGAVFRQGTIWYWGGDNNGHLSFYDVATRKVTIFLGNTVWNLPSFGPNPNAELSLIEPLANFISVIHIVNPANGNEIQQIAYSRTIDSPARFSPDDSMLAFDSERLGTTGTFGVDVVTRDGALRARYTGLHNASWTPDGKSLIMCGSDGIYRADASLGTAAKIKALQPGPGFCQVSPDGTRVAYNGSDRLLRIVTLDGSDPVQLTDGLRTVDLFAWSPDGSTLILGVDNGGFGSEPQYLVPADIGKADLLSDPRIVVVADNHGVPIPMKLMTWRP
jgi:WD40 repeat protein